MSDKEFIREVLLQIEKARMEYYIDFKIFRILLTSLISKKVQPKWMESA